jgi:serine/threonine protein kinase
VPLTPEEWRRAKALFEIALQRDPGERDGFLDEACAGDPRLRAEVASLIGAHERAGDFIEAPAFEAAAHLLVEDPVESSLEDRTIGPYLVRHEIGRGGMGVVYVADDTRLSRRVALKALPPGAGREPGRRERLRQEARSAAALSHPGIATIYALEEIGGELYLACEYVPGQTLRTFIQAGPLPLAQVVEIATQLAQALVAAHAHGVVHRDLKPENVIRTPAGVVKILDFGVARLENLASVRLTHNEAMLGTPGYMAPEQIRGPDADFRSDLFSLGVIVHEMASGSNPFEAETAAATIARILESDVAPLSDVSAAGAKLDQIVSTCLRKNPAERYASTLALESDLEQLKRDLSADRDREATDRKSPAAEGRRSARVLTPRRWWEIHQLAVSSTYALMMYPAWRVRAWLPRPVGMLFLFAVLSCAVVGTSLRLHLWFTARYYAGELSAQRARALPWIRWCDAGFAVSLFLAALAIGNSHSEVATLLITVSVAVVVASFMIEPTTTRAAFRGRSSGAQTPPRQRR